MIPALSEAGSVALLVRAICGDWRRGGSANARVALEQYPELRDDHSAYIDLAYEEFCLRKQCGENVEIKAFCARFPEIEADLQLVLSADDFLAEHASIVARASSGFAGVEAKPGVNWPAAGETLAGRVLLRELGRGAFARVYLALEIATGDRPVAVKVSCDRTVADSGEARTLGRLNHDHIMPILWAGVDAASGLSLVCMPFLGSVTLADIIDRFYPYSEACSPANATAFLDAVASLTRRGDPVPDVLLGGLSLRGLSFSESVARLGETLARTLAFLHARGLFHCDLKPSNLLLTPQGRPVLLDFNLARKAGQTGGLVGGTFAYMAPEQVRAVLTGTPLSAEQAARADLFSLGVILYELLTGRHPFGLPPASLREKEEVGGWFLERLQPDQPGVAPLGQAVPQRLANGILSTLAIEANDRPVSAEDLADRLRSRPRRTRRLVGLAVLMAAALLGAATLFPWRAGSAAPQAGRVGPGPLAEIAHHRVLGREALERGYLLRQAGPQEQAEAELRTATTQFRKVLDLQQEQREPLPGAWEDYFAQGRTLLLLGDLAHASTYLDRADELWQVDVARLASLSLAFSGGSCPVGALMVLVAIPPSNGSACAAIRASRSYCSSRLGEHQRALPLGRGVLQQGYGTAPLLNNLGLSALRAGDLPGARRYLNEALRRSPDFAPALFNRCQIPLRERQRPRAGPPTSIPVWALLDIDRAIELLRRHQGMEFAELYGVAAKLAAFAALDARSAGDASKEEATLGTARQYLLKGCEVGLDPQGQFHDPFLRDALGSWLTRDRLEGRRLRAGSAVLWSSLVDPLRGALR